ADQEIFEGHVRPPVNVTPSPVKNTWGCLTFRLGQEAAQFCLQHLAIIVLRQGFDKAVVAWALEAGDVLEAEPVERLGRDLGPGTRHDKGHDLLAPLAMRA